MKDKPILVEMKVDGLVIDPVTNSPIIVLHEVDGDATLPIWVGFPEATAIALRVENVTPPRPMTHDLIKNLLDGLGATVEKIIVNDLRDGTFYAFITLLQNGVTFEIDSRPSDAIALSLRVECPIFVARVVIENAKKLPQAGSAELESSEEEDEAQEQDFRKWLDDIRPSDFH